MPARVRIPVEHGEASLAAIDHQVLFIPIRLSRFTKDAAVFGMFALYIGGSPGSPQMCHNQRRQDWEGSWSADAGAGSAAAFPAVCAGVV